MPNEDYALVLDYLPTGRSSSFKSEPLAQIMGTQFFTLLEIIPKGQLKALEKIYVGKEERDKVEYIKRRISFRELTANSVSEISRAIEKVIQEDSQKFIDFFNNARSITIKRHQLELLPGLGKKHMTAVLNERRKGPFQSFEDLEKRVKLMPDPVKTLVKRVLLELEDETQRHFLFARPPTRERERF